MDPNFSPQPFFILLLLLITTTTVLVVAASNDTSAPAMSCKGSIEQCDRDSEMMMMDSEASRRFLLPQMRYITPGTMKRDQPVCNGVAPGDPYTSGGRCLPERSNPYHRGCSRYYRCKSDE